VNYTKINVLGTRGEVESSTPYHSHHSGILLDDILLLDLGEKEFLNYSPEYVFITHLHPDHAFFVRKSYKKPVNFSIPVYAPERYESNSNIKLVKKKMAVGSYVIQSIPTHHSKKVASTAFLIQHSGQHILYTGDLVWINKEYHHLFNQVDLVITEASFIRKGGRIIKDKQSGKLYGHAGIPNLIGLFKDHTSRILFVHFGEWFYADIPQARKKLNELGKQNNIQIIVGFDGMNLDI